MQSLSEYTVVSIPILSSYYANLKDCGFNIPKWEGRVNRDSIKITLDCL
jgi:hypothetical protein